MDISESNLEGVAVSFESGVICQILYINYIFSVNLLVTPKVAPAKLV